MTPGLLTTFGATGFAVASLCWMAGYRRTLQAPLNGALTALSSWLILLALTLVSLSPEANFGLATTAPINSEAVGFLTRLLKFAGASTLIGLGAWVGSLLALGLKGPWSTSLFASVGTVATSLLALRFVSLG